MIKTLVLWNRLGELAGIIAMKTLRNLNRIGTSIEVENNYCGFILAEK